MNENAARRSLLVTTVGIIDVIAGTFPLIEFAGCSFESALLSVFASFFRSIVPVGRAFLLGLLLVIGAIDIVLGLGALARKHRAVTGMILRSGVTLPFDYIDFRAGNQGGASFGLTVSVFIAWALLRYKSRIWFRLLCVHSWRLREASNAECKHGGQQGDHLCM